jgi:CheY-like chemotaxis protein
METTERYLRILIVEDCHDTATTTKLLLEIWGHEVHVAVTGRAALHVVETFQPDVVLLDIGLPGHMDGFEVARRLRELPWEDAPVLIAATGYEGATIRQRALDSGCQHFLSKPFDLLQLRAILASLTSMSLVLAI